MNSFIATISHYVPKATVTPLLLNAALESLIVLGLTCGLIQLSRRASASARHSIWFAGIACLVFLPLFSLILPAWEKPLWTFSTNLKSGNELMLEIELAPNRTSTLFTPERRLQTATTKAGVDPAGAQRIRTHLPAQSLMIATAIWLTGAGIILAYVGLGHVRLGLIRRRAQAFPSAHPLLMELCAELGIARPVKLLKSRDDVMPMTWGWSHPIVILPAKADEWTPERQRIVLLHELAHVKRGDCLSHFISRIVSAFYWFNPLVWLADRRMCIERERASDDLVLEGGCRASDYASQLVEIARSFRCPPKTPAIAMARSSQLESRIMAIVDNGRARRAPRGFVLSLLWAAMLSLVATIAAQKSQTNGDSESKALRQRQVARLQAFSRDKEKQSLLLAAQAKEQISPEYRSLFDAAIKGDGQTVTNMYESFKRRHPQYSRSNKEALDNPDLSLSTSYWSPVLEISMAYYDVMAGEPKYIQVAIDDVLGSIPRGSIYFGGTDPGRALPTAFSTAHVNGDPFFTLTQNALADGTYLEYLRNTYAGKIYTPTDADSRAAFQEYSDDARKRLEHDTKFPNEPRQIRPAEDVRIDSGEGNEKVHVSGQVAVMAINGLLTKITFDKNPAKEFYIEESFPLDWMYPYLEPHGLIMKINRQPLDTLSEEILKQDHRHWQARVDDMIGNWLTDETPVQTVAEFVEKVYAKRDLSGFQGDPRFVQNENAGKMFSKWRASIGGVYSWRISNSNSSPVKRQRMTKEADFAFRQAFAICPSSPEALFRYVNLLVSLGRVDDAIRLTEAAIKVSTQDAQFRNLLTELQRFKGQQQK
jgi:beta-lactamase regulating signal transducer with metallopeptidase domain